MMTCSRRRAYRCADGQPTAGTKAIASARAGLAALTRGRWVTLGRYVGKARVYVPQPPVDGKLRPDARVARDAREALVSLHPARRGVSRNRAKAQRKRVPNAKVQSIPPTRHERNRWFQIARSMRRYRYVEARRRGDSCAEARANAASILASPSGPIGRKHYVAEATS